MSVFALLKDKIDYIMWMMDLLHTKLLHLMKFAIVTWTVSVGLTLILCNCKHIELQTPNRS